MRGLVVVAGALLALVVAPAAQAETIGSALTNVPNGTVGPDSTVSSTSILLRNASPLSSGVITRWAIRAGASAPSVRLVVIRRTQVSGDDPGEVVARSEPFVPEPGAVSTSAARLSISMGDFIGIECCDGAPAGDYVSEGLPGSGTVDVWSPRLAPLAPAPPTLPPLNGEVLVNAAIEPDVDGDGFGDESQDGCPTVAGIAPDGCPTPPPAAPAPRVNTPPVVRFRAPAAGTAVGPTQAIELDVFDDAGSATVTVFDDDGQICALSAAPYSCTWRPTGADVGRATLLASAVDSDNRSTLGIVRVSVARFRGDLTRRVRGRKVTGRLVLPAAVEPALGCRGEVTVRRGPTTRTVALKRNCAYSARVGRRGRVRARFGGNPTVEPAT